MRTRAAKHGLVYGAAVATWQLDDPVYAALVAQQAAAIVPEYEGKRQLVQPAPDHYNFAPLDRLTGFAVRRGLKMRGHTLCWYAANPPWLTAAMQADTPLDAKSRLLTGYIDTVMRRYRGKVTEWDVVNEPLDSDGALRKRNIWGALGETYIDLAFHAARAADPDARLMLNEYSVEVAIPWNERRRVAMLALLDRLLARGVPVDGLGIQAHLRPYKDRFDQRVFADFLKRVADMGLSVSITELDLSDRGGPSDPARRDADMAAAARAFLDVALDLPQTRMVITWGLTDRHSWLTSTFASDPWPGGGVSRALPFDVNLNPKPLVGAIAAAFEAAPPRKRLEARRAGELVTGRKR